MAGSSNMPTSVEKNKLCLHAKNASELKSKKRRKKRIKQPIGLDPFQQPRFAKETGVDFANFKDVRVGPSNKYNHLKPKNYIACKNKNIR